MLREVNSNGNVKSLIVLAFPCVLYRMHGFFNTSGSTDFYLQVFDSTTLPANGTSPLESYQAQANFEFNVHIGEGLTLKKGLVVVLSSTPNTLTIATAGTDTMELFTDIEEYSTLSVQPTLTVVNSAGSVNFLSVWLENAGPKRLVRVNGNESNGVITYIMLFAKNNGNIALNEKPIRQWQVDASNTFDLAFGLNGIPVYSADTENGPARLGCTIGLSLVSGAYDGGNGAGVFSASYITPTSN